MEIIETSLEGCFQIRPFFAEDRRGTFVKTFHSEQFAARQFPTIWREEYYSASRKGVVRGMHFQLPPHDHEKLVYCMLGKVLDVIVDLRRASRTFGQHIALELDGARGDGLLIPKGMAHGFLALSEDAMMAYKVSTVYAPSHDAGIRWDSIGMDWGIDNPIVSDRDRDHPALADFNSPF